MKKTEEPTKALRKTKKIIFIRGVIHRKKKNALLTLFYFYAGQTNVLVITITPPT